MENRDRNNNDGRAPYDENRNRRAPRLEEEDLASPTDPNQQRMADLDGDGMIGNTGGFYGGTSYLGSNYGEDWNTEGNSRHEGNYGAAGQQDASNDNVGTPDDSSELRRRNMDGESMRGRLTQDDSIF